MLNLGHGTLSRRLIENRNGARIFRGVREVCKNSVTRAKSKEVGQCGPL